MESDRKPPCICAAQSYNFKTPLCGWCIGAGDVTRLRIKRWRKSKPCSNVFKASTFEHHTEPSKYIDEYRRKYTVGNVCNYNVYDLPKLGVDLFDPYAEKIKQIRSWKKQKSPEADDKKAENGMGDMGPNKRLPIIAQVLKSVSPKEKSYPKTKEPHPPKDRQLNLRLSRSTMSKLKNKSTCEVISIGDTISVRSSRSEGKAVDMISSSCLPKLVPVRTINSPKGKTSPDSKETHPQKDSKLNLQVSQSKTQPHTKSKLSSPDLVSETNLASRSSCEQPSSMCSSKRRFNRSYRISDLDNVISTDNVISVRASLSKSMETESTSTSVVHKLISGDGKVTEKHPNDSGKQAGHVINTKCYRLKYSKKITNPENRSCVNVTPWTLRDIGGISESDAENVSREKSTFYKLKQQSQTSKSLIDCITPVTKKVISHK